MVVDTPAIADPEVSGLVSRLTSTEADRVFHALADPTRRDILVRALHGRHSVSALARGYPMSFAAVQKHVAVLERAQLVTKERHGREQIVRSNLDTVRDALQLLEQIEEIWRARIDRMTTLLDRSQPDHPSTTEPPPTTWTTQPNPPGGAST